jgi:hypothetical protein
MKLIVNHMINLQQRPFTNDQHFLAMSLSLTFIIGLGKLVLKLPFLLELKFSKAGLFCLYTFISSMVSPLGSLDRSHRLNHMMGLGGNMGSISSDTLEVTLLVVIVMLSGESASCGVFSIIMVKGRSLLGHDKSDRGLSHFLIKVHEFDGVIVEMVVILFMDNINSSSPDERENLCPRVKTIDLRFSATKSNKDEMCLKVIPNKRLFNLQSNFAKVKTTIIDD